VTDTVIENHLLGRETVGAYPLLLDETCCFLAADFDKKTWAYDSQAFLWVFSPPWSVPFRKGRPHLDLLLPAITARKLGCVILTRNMSVEKWTF
jgi:hypothetical protein